ncbi:hypothetical protein ABBQ32_011928 [Trebouxia sp. C0010 RCD-2024]
MHFQIPCCIDGSELVTGIGSRVLVYETAAGDLLHSLRGHKAEGVVKYNHNDSVQVLAYNPLSQQLASGTANDFGLWSPDLKHVAKHKVTSKVVSLAWTNDGQFLALGLYDGHISIRTRVGEETTTIQRDAPVWTLSWNPNREHMTDVVVQHLITNQDIRIQCKDYVKKLAVYKGCLAVQLPKQITIYQLKLGADSDDMLYTPVAVIEQELECNLLVVTAQHLTLCQDRKLQLYSFQGVKTREWVMDSIIRYIKVVGGPAGREGLLLGLKDGQVVTIYIDNPFPVNLVKHNTSIRCLDLSSSRGKLAVVDDNNTVQVYSMQTKALLSQDSNANSVAWNTEFEDMLCFSGSGKLSTKTADFPLHQQKMQGFVVAFKGSQVFCLHYNSMQALEVPQSASMQGYLAAGDFDNACKVACLGVPDAQWAALGHAALQALELEVASKAFGRIKETRYLRLLHQLDQAQKAGQPPAILKADVLAYQGKYQEAARAYARAGSVQRAMDMFSDLRQFAEAKAWAEEWERTKASEQAPLRPGAMLPDRNGTGTLSQALVQKQAEWNEEMKDFQAAANMYLQAKKFDKAVTIMGRNQWWDKLNQVVGQLQGQDDAERTALRLSAAFFRRAGQTQFAKETYVKLQDYQASMLCLLLH